MSNNKENVSSHWAGFRRLWIIVAILLFILLVLMWLLGYGPGGSKCVVPPTIVEKTVEVEKLVDNPKLLSRIGLLEKENAGISGLQSKIKELQNIAPTIKTVEKLVTAPDAIAPQLILKGLSPLRMPVGSNFTDAGYMVLDNVDKDIAVKVTGKVDSKKAGEYLVTYSATDKAGNTSTVTRKVVVEAPLKDEIAPNLSLIGSAISKIELGETFVDTGAISMDNVDGRASIVVKGKVDNTKSGEYILTYTSTDAAGNTSTVKRKVIVEAAPAMAKLYFEVDSAEFPADTELSLATVISYLRTHSSSEAVVSGFHDSSGSLAHNQELSFNRAVAVRDLLQKSGITADRIVISKPAVTTGTGEAREARRVEVRATK